MSRRQPRSRLDQRRYRHSLSRSLVTAVYRRTLRDSRNAVVVVGGVLALMLIAAAGAYGRSYTTPASRVSFANLLTSMPAALRGVTGDPHPANLTTLGGMVSFKDATWVCGIAALWSIVALSASIAGEARRGRLELVIATPVSRRRVAVEKVAAHVTGMAIIAAICAATAWLFGIAFGSLPGDAVTVGNAIGFGLWVMLMALASGSVAFALAPLVGRAGAAGIATAVTVGGALAYGYETAAPWLRGLGQVTWFGWTGHDQPLAGQPDWMTLIPVVAITTVLLGTGVELTARRDVGATISIPWLCWPRVLLGLGGPLRRAAGDRLPIALAWGLGLGVYGFVIGDAASAVAASIKKEAPTSTLSVYHTLFPGVDIGTTAGLLQIAFVAIGLVLAGVAAVTLVSGWAADEANGRLDVLLGTRLSRERWLITSALGTMAAVVAMTVVTALGIALGALAAGSDGLTPLLGSAALGLYAIAVVGVGVAVGGWIGARAAAPVCGAAVGATFLLSLLAPGLHLPGWVGQLALTSHLGQPMVGQWDGVGVIACLGLAGGGVALGTWGMRRRDVGR